MNRDRRVPGSSASTTSKCWGWGVRRTHGYYYEATGPKASCGRACGVRLLAPTRTRMYGTPPCELDALHMRECGAPAQPDGRTTRGLGCPKFERRVRRRGSEGLWCGAASLVNPESRVPSPCMSPECRLVLPIHKF